MAIRFRCPHCDSPLEARDDLAGKKGNCPKCKKEITVPAKEESTRAEQ